MASYDGSSEVSRELLEYLEQGPHGDNMRLTKIVQSLNDLGLESGLTTFQVLGTAVGKQKAWQGPFRSSGLLQAVLQNLDNGTSPALIKQYLRVIGNCVADNDENREVAVDYLEEIIACMAKKDLTATTLAVLFNLFNDFEPAHDHAAKLRMDDVLASYIIEGAVPEEALDYATDLLHSTTEKLSPTQLVDDVSLKVFGNILKASMPYNEDHFQEYLSILVHYLQDSAFQQKVATADNLERLVDLMLDFETRLSTEDIDAVFRELSTQTESDVTRSEETSVVIMVRLASSLAAISASDAFVNSFTSHCPLMEKVKSKLLSADASPFQICACVMFGNLANSDRVCIDMVEDMGLHEPLIRILSTGRESALLYAAAGFMRHLTFPEVNRSSLGQAGLIETCCRLLAGNDPAVRGEAAAIICKLVSNNLSNIERVVHGNIPEGVAAIDAEGIALPARPTILYYIVTQALAPSAPLPSTTMKNPMIELGRSVVSILRYIGQSKVQQDVDVVAHSVFATPAVARPVARLVRQRFYADARSEGLLGLGLMAQSPEGAACVLREMQADGGLLKAIQEFAVEQKGGQENNEAAGRDYQNAVVLLHGLCTHGMHAMDAALKSSVESLQEQLSRLMV